MGGYRIGGERMEDTTQKWNMYSIAIDEHGVLTDINDYLEPFQTGMRKMVATSDGGFALAGFLGDVQANMYLLRADEQGEFIYGKFVGREAYTNHATTLCATPDGGFLLGGEIQPYDSTVTAPPTHPYLVKVNADGEAEWDTIYWNSTPPYARIIDIEPVPDENAYYLLVQNGITYDTCDIWIVKINEMGQILWEHTIDWGNGEYPRALHIINDGNFLISASQKVGTEITGFIIKMDTLGNIEWMNTNYFYRVSPTSKVVELEDGSFILSGYFLRYPPGFGSDVESELVKLSANGEEIWHRTFGTPENDQYFYDMTATPDGGFIMCGRDETGISPTMGASLYVVKTNCMGLLTEPEAAFEYDAVDAYNVQFINQSQFVYPDSTDGGRYLWSFGDGTTSTEPHPQHSFPDAAEYQVTLTAIVCSDTSIYTQTVSTEPTGINPQATGGKHYRFAAKPQPGGKRFAHLHRH